MAFLTEIDSIGLLEEHVSQVVDLEKDRADKLLAVYRKAQVNLRRRLRMFRKDQFSAQQIRVVLVQVEAVINALRADLTEEMVRSGNQFWGIGTQHLINEIDSFQSEFRGSIQLLPLRAIESSLEHKNYLINNFEASIETYSNSIRQLIANDFMVAVAERLTPEQIYDRMLTRPRLHEIFEGEAWRMRRIVRTELHNIYGQAKRSGLKKIEERFEPDMMKTLYHPMDARTDDDSKYVHSLNLIRKINEPFQYTWRPIYKNGRRGRPITRVFQNPPDRPNDRSILIPYHPSWDER